jgi:hypothetical protein
MKACARYVWLWKLISSSPPTVRTHSHTLSPPPPTHTRRTDPCIADASQSLFLYDRQFYQGENGARLYPASCYYCANLTLELLLNAGNGLVYALISYYMLNYQVRLPVLGAYGAGWV